MRRHVHGPRLGPSWRPGSAGSDRNVFSAQELQGEMM